MKGGCGEIEKLGNREIGKWSSAPLRQDFLRRSDEAMADMVDGTSLVRRYKQKSPIH